MADSDTPVSAYAKLGAGEYSFLLESVVGGEKWAAYSFIGVQPRAVLTSRNGHVTLLSHDVEGQGKSQTRSWTSDDPAAALAEVMKKYRPVASEHLPRFWGGAVGWLSYDAVRSFEKLPELAADELDVPELCMVLTDTLVIFDNLRQSIKVVATPFVEAGADASAAYESAILRIDAIVETLRTEQPRLREMRPPSHEEDGSASLRFGGMAEPEDCFAKDDFLAGVSRIKEYILAGDIFQCVLSRRLKVPQGEVTPFDVYRALRVVNPSPYMFHLEFPEAQVTGASPETLVRCDRGRVEVRPIAGTRPRGTTVEEDEALAQELQTDPKECAEHLMLIDLGRNDVGRVSKTGSVVLSESMVIERYSHVMHLVSNVHGDLKDGLQWDDALRAAFPAGTLSGAPKIRAMEIIEELEPTRRGVYGGAVGYVSYSGNMDVAIAIRTLVTKGGNIYVQSGGGVVHDSSPEGEYEETLNKARGVLRAVALAGAVEPSTC
ncbi:MAG: anthranilate synthase component I [Myxococcales bacterium]|nr:anthranilate synthase component I [Myxococcales bacterium]